MNCKLRKKLKLEKAGMQIWNAKAGFVSLIALMLANVFLIIGMSVFSIAIRELALSSGGKESALAFFAADGGIECALYWDIQQHAFATSTPAVDINCVEQNIVVTKTDLGGGASQSEFGFNFVEGDIATPFVAVKVLKNADGTTVIEARGRNTGDTANLRRVERAWRVSY